MRSQMRMRACCGGQCINTGVLVCAGFALGTLGKKDCPAGYFRIVTEDVCRSAAAAAGLAYQGREYFNSRFCNLQEEGVFMSDWVGIGKKAKLLCSGARLHLYSRHGPSWVLTGADWQQKASLGELNQGAIAGRSGAAGKSAIGPGLCGTRG
jgi:hypothetical protein